MDLRAATVSTVAATACGIRRCNAQHVVAPHEAAVEEGQPRRHEIHQRTGDQDPGRVAGVDFPCSVAHGLRLRVAGGKRWPGVGGGSLSLQCGRLQQCFALCLEMD